MSNVGHNGTWCCESLGRIMEQGDWCTSFESPPQPVVKKKHQGDTGWPPQPVVKKNTKEIQGGHCLDKPHHTPHA